MARRDVRCKFTLRADGVTVWTGPRKPNQSDADFACRKATGMGWNGCTLDLFKWDDLVGYALPSEEALSYDSRAIRDDERRRLDWHDRWEIR
jgi:hypothetical protein